MSRQLSAYCDRPSQELDVCTLFLGPLWRCTWLVKGAKAPAGLLYRNFPCIPSIPGIEACTAS